MMETIFEHSLASICGPVSEFVDAQLFGVASTPQSSWGIPALTAAEAEVEGAHHLPLAFQSPPDAAHAGRSLPSSDASTVGQGRHTQPVDETLSAVTAATVSAVATSGEEDSDEDDEIEEEDADAAFVALFSEEVLRSQGWAVWGAAKKTRAFLDLSPLQKRRVQKLRRDYQSRQYALKTRKKQQKQLKELRKEKKTLHAQVSSLQKEVRSLREKLKDTKSKA